MPQAGSPILGRVRPAALTAGCDQGRRCVAARRRPALAKVPFISLRRACDKVHSRVCASAVQPPYHNALAAELVLFDGNSIPKVCTVTSERSGGGDWRSKADALSRERTTKRGELIYKARGDRVASILFVDVLVTQLG